MIVRAYLFMNLIAILLMSVCMKAASASTPLPDKKLTDAEIVGISLITDRAQIAGSEVVCEKLEYWDLKNLCHVVLNDNRGYENALVNFVKQQGITPVTSEVSDRIEKEGKEALEKLTGLPTGRELDLLYLSYELTVHQDGLKMIREDFLPNVKNYVLGKMLYDNQPNLQNRLDWVMRIQQAIGR